MSLQRHTDMEREILERRQKEYEEREALKKEKEYYEQKLLAELPQEKEHKYVHVHV